MTMGGADDTVSRSDGGEMTGGTMKFTDRNISGKLVGISSKHVTSDVEDKRSKLVKGI